MCPPRSRCQAEISGDVDSLKVKRTAAEERYSILKIGAQPAPHKPENLPGLIKNVALTSAGGIFYQVRVIDSFIGNDAHRFSISSS
jgi:hypothetical protein